MQNRWNDDAAARCAGELALRAYSSRLLGSDPALVLLGGGNTSLKVENADGTAILYVKGTGADLAHVTGRDFTPLKLAPVRAMLQKQDLDYAAMMKELAEYVTTPDAPKPSIETLLHAALPARFVEHTHADSVLAITNTEAGMPLVEKVFGELALVVPYRHSGFALAKICAETWAARATEKTIGIVLMHHGIVACGATARESYENMLRLVGVAEAYLAKHGSGPLPAAAVPRFGREEAVALAELRQALSRIAGYPLLLTRYADPVAIEFARNAADSDLVSQSPATPQHAVFARRLPMVGRDLDAFARNYAQYLKLLPLGAEQLDAAPRIVLDPDLGLLAAGITPWHMDAAATSYRHTIETIQRAGWHDKYKGLPPKAVLEAELEYGGFERRIARDRKPSVALAGTSSLLSPSLGKLQEPVADTLIAAGGAVAAFGLVTGREEPAYCALGEYDDPLNLDAALIKAVARFGGIDTLVCTPTDVVLVERTLPWLSLAASAPHVILLKHGEMQDHGAAAILEKLCVRQIIVDELDIATYFSPLQLAQAIARAIAIPPMQNFTNPDQHAQ
jgi:rhamnose utilization protein RhaD (predicted bifunctional aldolase and dehydrogenase)